jgi:alkylation response protein AidB-like acyl-CoA dehydrogenase
MEFAFTEEQEAVAEAAVSVFMGMASSERVAQIEKTPERYDAELWLALARANLLGLAVPAEHDGSGLGMVEVCQVLEAQGRAVAPVPLWATVVLGAMPIARFGTPEQRDRWLPAVVSGDVRLTAALADVARSTSNGRGTTAPQVRAQADPGGWILRGIAHSVPQAHLAAQAIVPAVTEDGDTLLLLVGPQDPGVTLERATTTDRQVHPHMHLDGVTVASSQVLVAPGEGIAAVQWMLERARTGLCAMALGVCEEAVRRAAAYLNERHQFGRPLSSFQGTMLRAADAYIDTEAIRVTLWQAAWRLDTGRPADEAVAAAKWWASEAGQRVVHATQHLHGGMGADVEYPIHRYFLWGKQIELMLGGPTSELARLGAMVASRIREGGSR